MRYFYKDKEILSKEEWKNAFCKSYNGTNEDKHWKVGRSAERLAEDFMGKNPQGEKSLVEMVKQLTGAQSVSLNTAKIEHTSVFDKYNRPRIQDLAIWGEADGKKIFIGVEAKVDEPFGSVTLTQQKAKIKKMKEEKKSTDADKRLNDLVRDFLDNKIDENESLSYQLLYYLAGSFREKDVDIIIMPVIVYKSDLYNETKGKKNHATYTSFMNKLLKKVEGRNDIYYKYLTVNGISKSVYSCYIIKDNLNK